MATKREVRAGAWSGVSSTVKQSEFQGREGEQAKRNFLGESMSRRVDAKALLEDLKSADFNPSLAKPKMGKEVGRQKACS